MCLSFNVLGLFCVSLYGTLYLTFKRGVTLVHLGRPCQDPRQQQEVRRRESTVGSLSLPQAPRQTY